MEGFPAPGWDRYQPVLLLGEGGMGRVFLAYDPRLRRHVALKFLHADSPVRTQRFFAEARAQARVQHDRVCKVFEVGEVEGKPFIAMQYVEGLSLRQLGKVLTLEQKVTVLRDAAEGVHAAHRAGLIHRDLTPSNIMVQRTEDGALKAYVMDFGLARDWQGEGTATGSVLGTPQYMAPEQARGELGELDRRADVYSLGATLYFLLTGQHPVSGSNALEVLSRVGSEEPPAPRSLVPELPLELEAIVLKCLEKDRARRYDSARALIEDLERYLNGEPVLARTAGTLYRLRKRARKHRLLLALSAACLLLLGLAGAQTVLARRQAAERERLAGLFTEQVEGIEARARYAALSPLHDTRADRKALRERMAQLEAEIARAGPVAVGPGRYALGRGHLALGDVARAHADLSAAWAQGYRDPRVAYALALVLGRQYQQARLGAERLQPAELRQLEQRYRDPALHYLKLSAGSEVPSPAYVAALLAFYEGRFDDALRELDRAGAAPPWFYEALALRGDVLAARALRASLQGQYAPGLADFEAGRRAYAQALGIGRSAPELYLALGELEYAAMVMELYRKGDTAPQRARGMEAVALARTASPEDAASFLLEARFQRRLAEQQVNRGEDATGTLQQALGAAGTALALAPERSDVRLEQARLYRQWALQRQQRGLDPREQLAAAAAVFDGVPSSARDYAFHTTLGLLFKVWAEYEDETGVDSLGHSAQAISAYLAATALDAQRAEAWVNLARVYRMRALNPRQQDPDGELRRAREAVDRSLTLDAQMVAALFQSAQVGEDEAARLRDRGQDPTARLRQNLVLYQRALALNPRMPQLHNGAGHSHLALARAERDAGRSPEHELQRAQEAFEQARVVAPGHGYAELNLGEVEAERAASALERGEDPAAHVERAGEWLRQAKKQLPGFADAWVTEARVQSRAAAHALQRGQDPSGRLRRADQAVREALTRNPRDVEAWEQRAQCTGLQAHWAQRQGQRAAALFEEAAAAYRKAAELAPRRLEGRLAHGRFQLQWARALQARGEEAGPQLAQGLRLADEVLAARPQLAEARRLRAELLSAGGTAAQKPEREAAPRSATGKP